MTGVDRGKAVLAPGPFIRSRRPHPLTNYSAGGGGGISLARPSA
jgi:hypothetical protein